MSRITKIAKANIWFNKERQTVCMGKEQQDSFEDIKWRLIKPPVLCMSSTTGRFHLYPDKSKFMRGSVLYQIQNGKPKLITYVSKWCPEAAKNYSITKLEPCGLAINITSFSHLLKRVDFDAIVDHLSLTYIMKSKAEPATTKIKRLIELISSYPFNVYHIKGKDMVLSDFLSRQNHDDSNPHDAIPISFNIYQVLHEKYYDVENIGNYLVQAWSQTKSSGIKLPEVQGMRKNLNPTILSEKQLVNPIKGSIEKPHIGPGRAGLRRRIPSPINQPIISPSELSQKIPREMKIETSKTNCVNSTDPTHSINNEDEGMTHTRPFIPDVPFYPGPTYRPPPKLIRSIMSRSQESSQSSDRSGSTNINTDINLDFEENSPFQEGIISEAYQRPDKSFLQEPQELNNLINTSNLIQ